MFARDVTFADYIMMAGGKEEDTKKGKAHTEALVEANRKRFEYVTI